MSRKVFASVEDAVEYSLGLDISETMATIPPDVDELIDEYKVDQENLDTSTFCDITRAEVSKLFPWRATLLIF